MAAGTIVKVASHGRGKRKGPADRAISKDNLTVWDLVSEFTKIRDKAPNKSVETDLARKQIAQELGEDADSDLIDLFTSTTAATGQGNDDGDLFGSTFELDIIESNNSINSIPKYSGAYKVNKGKKWSPELLATLYKAAAMFGDDPTMINAFLPKDFTNRDVSRRLAKEKFTKAREFENACKAKERITTEWFQSVYGNIQPDDHFDAAKFNAQRTELSALVTGEVLEEKRISSNVYSDMFETELF